MSKLFKSSDKIQGLCGHCSINYCNACITSNSLCHISESNRSICAHHSKNSRVVAVDSDRVLVAMGSLNAKDHHLFTQFVNSTKENSSHLFTSFYSDFNGTARFYEIFDYDDSDVWMKPLSFSGIYLFTTAEVAKIALNYFSKLVPISFFNDPNFVAVNDFGKVQFQICYQCNCYQARFPFYRTLRDPNNRSASISRTFGPNFYADSLCRKVNSSHDKKRKGGRKKANNKGDNDENLSISSKSSKKRKLNSKVINHAFPDDESISSVFQNQTIAETASFADPYEDTNESLELTAEEIETSLSLAYWNTNLSPLFNFSAISATPSVFKGLKDSGATPIPNSHRRSFDPILNSNELFQTNRRNSFIRNKVRESLTIIPETDEKLHFIHESTSNDSNFNRINTLIEKNNNSSFEYVDDNDSKLWSDSGFNEEYAWQCMDEWDFVKLRNYLVSNKIDVNKEPILFTKFEVVKLYTYIKESIEAETTNSLPSVPTVFNNALQYSDIYAYSIPKFDYPSSDELLTFDMVYFKEMATYDRHLLITNLSSSINDLSPVLSSIESNASRMEPILHILFRFFRFFYLDLGQIDFTNLASNYDKLMNNYCALILESYNLFKYFSEIGVKPECMIMLKNLNLLYQSLFCGVINRARLLDLRSKATIQILDSHKEVMSSLLNESKSKNLLDTIIYHCNYKSTLQKTCVPKGFQWINVDEILQYIVRSSFISNDVFTLNILDIESDCICSIMGQFCRHKLISDLPRTVGNFCIPYMPSRVFLEFGLNSLEEYFTKIYILHMNKLQFNHEFLPVDIILNKNQINIPPITKNNLLYFADSFDGQSNIFRQHPLFNLFYNSALRLKEDVSGPGIPMATELEIRRYRNSLPLFPANSLSIESSFEESQTWTKLAVQLAYISQDIFMVTHTTLFLIRNYIYVGRDYVAGIEELDKLVLFHYNCLLLLPRTPSNTFMRRFVQNNIIRENSILFQYKQYELANTGPIFFPGQLMSVIIDGNNRDVIYMTFELNSRPIYLSSFESLGGECYAMVGTDLSISTNWRSIALDNVYFQYGGSYLSLMTQRFLFHALRTGEYSFKQFRLDLIKRNQIKL